MESSGSNSDGRMKSDSDTSDIRSKMRSVKNTKNFSRFKPSNN